jgi:uncharacterized Fe-S cluster-containing radical SAM superfamily protein
MSEKMSNFNIIDTGKFSEHLRSRGLRPDTGEVLVTRFTGSEEEKDFTLPANCGGFGRIHHFRRSQGEAWPENPLPIDPACKALGLAPSESLQVQVFQNAICSWRCWYCFVDFDLLSANPKFSEFKTSKEMVELYLAETTRPRVIDLSGGQPDLVPEWGYWMHRELKAREMLGEVYLWTDDNLSNDYLWRFLDPGQIRELAASPSYGRVGCFKGFDAESFSFNTKAAPALFAEQFLLMKRLVAAQFDVYGYATLTSSSGEHIRQSISDFVDRLQDIHPIFPLRTIPLKIQTFTPTSGRLDSTTQRALDIQHEAVLAWTEELTKRFSDEMRSRPITEQRLDSR